ncbi:MAG: ArsA family ATPase [Actinobacteria bacterium]|nr:MAG: ArsA family ATPase [Actinomycetota bacterium]
MRVILFTGKGGVGKTTVAAATAVRAAKAGDRTLVMSTDPAHSLADSFETRIGSAPTRIIENLWGQEIDAQERLEDNWRDIQDYMVQLMNWAGTETIQAEELTVIPGLDEIFALIDVKTHVQSGNYDCLVVDCAPTAETLRLLSLPEIMSWYIERIFPVERKVVKAVRPLVSRMTSLPIASDQVFDAVERLHRNLDAVKVILTDEAVSSVIPTSGNGRTSRPSTWRRCTSPSSPCRSSCPGCSIARSWGSPCSRTWRRRSTESWTRSRSFTMTTRSVCASGGTGTCCGCGFRSPPATTWTSTGGARSWWFAWGRTSAT